MGSLTPQGRGQPGCPASRGMFIQGLGDDRGARQPPLLPAIRAGPLRTGRALSGHGAETGSRAAESAALPRWGLCVGLAGPPGAQMCGRIFPGCVCRGVAAAGRAQLSWALAAGPVTVKAVHQTPGRGGVRTTQSGAPGSEGPEQERALSV